MMKYALIFILLSAALSSAPAREIRDYPVKKIGKRTYVIHGPLGFPNRKNRGFMNNPVFVLTKSGVVVIDPGSSVQAGRMVLRRIRRITRRPVTHVLNTHIHGDHWLGNQAFARAFPRVKLMAHPRMIALARAGAGKDWVRIMDRMTGGATRGTRPVIPTIAIRDGYSFRTGGVKFMIHAPAAAHSDTDIMIHIVNDSVVVLGDNVLYKRLPRMNDATFQGNIKACDVALRLKARRYVPGHGPTGGARIVKLYRRYLSTVYSEVKKHTDEGLSDYEMKPKVVAKLKPYWKWKDFQAEVGKHINRAMLEIEKSMMK